MALMRFMERILEHPAVYAASQALFIEEKFAVIQRHLQHQRIRRILDVGCGPGINAPLFGDVEYVGIDVNERYLEVARQRYRGRFIQADVSTADLAWLGTFDTILVNSLLHHLPDKGVRAILRQLRALLEPTGTIHMLELMWPDRGSVVGLVGAAIDRGRYARRIDAWRQLFEEHFETLSLEPHAFKAGLWAQLYFRGKPRP